MVLQAIYDLGKQLLVEKNNNDALTYLESLEDEPEHAMNAALLISVIYQSMNTELAELYRTQFVDLEKATDWDAIDIYENIFPPRTWQDLMNLDNVLKQNN